MLFKSDKGDIFEKKVYETIIKYNMIENNDRIVVGVSGGPDSMTLINILANLRAKYNLKLFVANVNHSLRPEADEETDFVHKYCNERNIDFFSKKVDVNKISNEEKIGLEEAGRNARYDFFTELCFKTNSNKIAIAHNENDNAETVIMNLFRGSGVSGLNGILPVRKEIIEFTEINKKVQENNNIESNEKNVKLQGKFNICYKEKNIKYDNIKENLQKNLKNKNSNNYFKKSKEITYIRPLIKSERKDIENYCYDVGIIPRIDKTNFEEICKRNKIRNTLIPYIKKEFNPNIVEGLSRLSDITRSETEFIDKYVFNEYNNLLIEEENINNNLNLNNSSDNSEILFEKNKNEIISEILEKDEEIKTDNMPKIKLDLKKFNKLDNFIKSEIILLCVKNIFGTTKGIEMINISDIIKLCERNIGNKFLKPKKDFKVSVKKGVIIFERD